MSAAQILKSALNAGVSVRLAGNDLALKAAAVPAVEIRDLLARHKVEIIAFLRHGEGSWKAEDWRGFFDERAGIAEFDGGLSRTDAGARAFACCVSEWLIRHPATSPAGHCVGCGKGEQGTPAILPYGTQKAGFAWLHADCWLAWHDRRVANAKAALNAMGIVQPARPEAVP